MDYRIILKEQLRRRQELNPRLSLRAFAAKLGISPSKISEVFSGKKNLSVARLEEIAQKFNLKGTEKEIFLLSAELDSKKSKNKEDLRHNMKKLAQELKAEQTTQRNAWYFGAVKALEEAGFASQEFQAAMGLTSLQIENAQRFLNRIQRFHPEREELRFEPLSLLKKINESLMDSSGDIQADFALLTPDQAEELKLKIKSLVKKFKNDRKKINPQDLKMVYFGMSEVILK